MILIIDNNDFRREKICKKLYMESIPAIGCAREEEKGYSKPLITIIVDPKQSEYNRIYNNSDSNFYLCSKKPLPNLPSNRVIVDRECFVYPDKIREILQNDFNINLKEDHIGPVSLYTETHDLYVGGAYMHLGLNQFALISFLVYNYGRRFSVEEIYDYLHLKKSVKMNSFRVYVSMVNGKGKKNNRGRLIEEYNEFYYLTDHIVNAIRRVKLLQSKQNKV